MALSLPPLNSRLLAPPPLGQFPVGANTGDLEVNGSTFAKCFRDSF